MTTPSQSNVGVLVFIADQDMRSSGPHGKMVQVIPGSDGRALRVYVQTINGVLLRPVINVAALKVPIRDTYEVDHQQCGSGNVFE